jgi:hypothetical protein
MSSLGSNRVLALAVVLALGVAAAAVTVLVRRHQQVAETRRRIEAMSFLLVEMFPSRTRSPVVDVRKALVDLPAHLLEDACSCTDAWGRPFLFRAPGLVHPKGFDLYSTGPNGVDEGGDGDDIVGGGDSQATGLRY